MLINSNFWILEWTLEENSTVTVCVCVLVAQLCLTLCDPMDCSPPGSSVHVLLQARVLEWAAISFSTTITSLFLCSVAESSPTLCNPMDCCTPVFSALHHLLELVQAHVY